MKRLEGPIVLFLLVAAVTIVLAAQDKTQGGRPLSATLTGPAEVPGPGDADGAGTFKAELNPGQTQLCYELSVSNIGMPATAAHVHIGAPDKAGPPVVNLKPPTDDTAVKECVDVEREALKKIIQKPADYYINVHNPEFPDGAVRGQLSK